MRLRTVIPAVAAAVLISAAAAAGSSAQTAAPEPEDAAPSEAQHGTPDAEVGPPSDAQHTTTLAERSPVPVADGMPVVADTIFQLGQRSGFAGQVVDEAGWSIDVYWKGPVPLEVRSYGAGRPYGVRVDFHETGAYSRAEAQAAADRLVANTEVMGKAGITSISVNHDGSGLTVSVAGDSPAAEVQGRVAYAAGLDIGALTFRPHEEGVGQPLAASIQPVPIDDAMPAVADRLYQLGGERGFTSLRTDYDHGTITVLWKGQPPADVLDYIASRPSGITISVTTGAKYSRAELQTARARILDSDLAEELSIVTADLHQDGSGLTVGAQVQQVAPSQVAQLRAIAGIEDVTVETGAELPVLYGASR